jgi:hypothetical protein
MDKAQYSTLLDALKDVPDPRKARGQRYSWLLLLTLFGGALAKGGTLYTGEDGQSARLEKVARSKGWLK